MDYAFAPGRTGQDNRVRNMFNRMDNTTLINRHSVTTVRQFIQHLSSNGSVTRPIEDALNGAHANAQGFLFISMYPGQQGPTSFETLEDTMSNSNRSIEIPDATIGHAVGDPITHSFHFKGCNIGKAVPFLEKLKEALGGNVQVSAPKHFHFLSDQRNFGTIEGLSYQFIMSQPTPLANRAALLTAFQNSGNFEFYDSSNVPDAKWEEWLPSRIRPRDLKRRYRKDKYVNLNLGQTIGTRTTVRYDIEFRTDKEQFNYTINFPSTSDVPNGATARKQALEDSLNNDPQFDASHDFPIYERWGYHSLNDFIQGYTWDFDKNGRMLVCLGTRFSYTLLPPIVEISTGDFLFNYYPASSSSNAAITNGLVVTDNRFFTVV
ncbi:hypothetical protein [Galbibacter sp.]|uniref:hypothetical protein n=1 Tax=Galbibacter sp. TaxID=2918471 RepID=UPI003A8D3A58